MIAPLLLAAPSPAEWFATRLPDFTGRYDVADSTSTWLGAEAVLASLPTVHARLVADYGATPAAVAKWLISWMAGELAGAVGFTLAAASAGLLVRPDAVRWRVGPDGRPARVDPGPGAVVVAAGHPWAGLDGVEVVDDPVGAAVRALVEVLPDPARTGARPCRARPPLPGLPGTVPPARRRAPALCHLLAP